MPCIVGFAAFPFGIDTTGVTFVPRSSREYKLVETIQLGEERTRFNPFRNPEDLSGVSVPQQTQDSYSLLLMFAVGQDDNLFTADRITAMQQVGVGLPGGQGRQGSSITLPLPCQLVNSIRLLDDSNGATGYADVCLRERSTGVSGPLQRLCRLGHCCDLARPATAGLRQPEKPAAVFLQRGDCGMPRRL